MNSRPFILAFAAAALLAACSSEPVARIGTQLSTLVQGKGAPSLSAGVRHFEEGNYGEATKNLRAAIDLGLSSSGDVAKAHKYLAFIHCASKRPQLCREEFVKALDANPSMELDPAEAGHPIWGPAFKGAKARR